MVRSRLMCSVFAVFAAAAAAAWLMPLVPSATAEPNGAVGRAQMASVQPNRTSDRMVDFAAPILSTRSPSIADQSALPTVTGVSIESALPNAAGPTVVEGTARTNRMITLTVSGRVIGEARTGANGTWRLSLPNGLGAGDHRIIAVATSRDGARKELSDVVRIAIPEALQERCLGACCLARRCPTRPCSPKPSYQARL
jgi:hypothetical protein